MSITADYHMHSHNSGDSKLDMSEMLEYLIKNNIKDMCFTDHYDADYVYDSLGTPFGTFELDLPSYRKEFLQIKEKYGERINVNFGVELGIQTHLADSLKSYVENNDFDFIIASNHLCHRKDPYYPYFFEGRTDKEAFREYFESVLESVKAFKDYDVFGHLDYAVRYAPNRDMNYFYKDYSDLFEEILRTIVEDGHGLELNTKGFRYDLKSSNPSEDILRRYRELGGEIITIGSDAHEITELAWGLERAAEILKCVGFKYYTTFNKRVPAFHEL